MKNRGFGRRELMGKTSKQDSIMSFIFNYILLRLSIRPYIKKIKLKHYQISCFLNKYYYLVQ